MYNNKEVRSVINFERYHTIAKHFCTIAQLQTASIKAFLVLQEKLENTQVLLLFQADQTFQPLLRLYTPVALQ